MNDARHYGSLLACGVLMLLTAGRLCAGPGDGSYRETRDAWQAEQAAKTAQAPYSESERQVMQRAAQDLARSLPDPGIKPGEQAPDFTLSNAYGKPVRLADRLREGPVVLVFYRGAWCPFCNLYLRTLYEQLTAIEAHGAQLLLVTPQTPDRSRKQMEEGRYRFEVLSDLDGAVMKAYRLYFELDPELVRHLRRSRPGGGGLQRSGAQCPAGSRYVYHRSRRDRACHARGYRLQGTHGTGGYPPRAGCPVRFSRGRGRG